MSINKFDSVFHEGEQIVQERMGVRETSKKLGSRFVRDHLTAEQQEFYQELPFIFVGSVDESGRPWASVLYGRPGFLSTPADSTLRVQASPFFGDPLRESLVEGAELGFLGIEFDTRRRNRVNGRVVKKENDSFDVMINQSFGNCPQYIQSRQIKRLPEGGALRDPGAIRKFTRLSEHARRIINKADNFYIATYFSSFRQDKRQGADVSHRGGRPGFVRVVDERTVKFPDFPGNNLFNTLGNIELNPVAGLLFIDFDTGDLLYLTGDVKVDWGGVEVAQFDGAQRFVELSITSGLIVVAGLPFQWSFKSYSPTLEQTGTWEEVVVGVLPAQDYRDYRVYRTENESEAIRSFYLKPDNGDTVPAHRAGQYLPIEISVPDEPLSVRRTYTISNAPNGEFFRISIKRELPRAQGIPPGVASNYLHDHVVKGSVIRVAQPQGDFVLEEDSTRPVVLLSGGVGITPMLSMLQQLLRETDEGACKRQIWFIHAAQNSALQGFRDYLQAMERRYPNMNLYTVYSEPLPGDKPGVHFDATGFVNVDLLKKLLPLDDYEYYYCGPRPFMESLKQGLDSINIHQKRVHWEYFGAPPTRSQIAASTAGELGLQTVQICFQKSAKEATWNSTHGSLLDFAESEGLHPVYSCRSGICQTCATPLVSGEVDYVQEPVVEPPSGSVLICCAIPHLMAPDAPSGKLVLGL